MVNDIFEYIEDDTPYDWSRLDKLKTLTDEELDEDIERELNKIGLSMYNKD